MSKHRTWLERMGIYSWDLGGGFGTLGPVCTPRLTIRCEYPNTPMPPTEVSFRISRSYGLLQPETRTSGSSI